MDQVNIHAAKTHLSRLVERAAKGHPFIIAKAGKPLVQVTAIPVSSPADRLGFIKDEIMVPNDFDTMGRESIERLFGGDEA
jgi:prevent-host-death family protein